MTVKAISETLVLVIDDNAMSRAVVEHRLSHDGFRVVTASSGDEGLAAVVRDEGDTFDLIFLDLVMDDMSGMEVLTELKGDDRFNHIPVVVISGSEDARLIADAKKAGAVDFLSKPVTAPTLRKIISDILGTPLVESANGGEAMPFANATPGTDQSPVLEQASIEQLKNDYGKDTASGFINQFTDLAPGQRDEIAAARDAGEIDVWNRVAHDLKGGARTMGLTRLAAICRDIELACKDGRIEDAHKSTDAMNEHFDEALKGLREYAAGI